MSTIITTTSGISYANSAGSAGPYFPIKYALPVYDPFLDNYLLSATLYPASACEPISAVWPRGEVIYNTTSLTATYNYTVSNTKMLVSAAGQAGTTTITGNPFNAVGYINLLNGKPLSPVVSGTSLNYSNGSWLVGGYTGITNSQILNQVSGYSGTREIYFPVVSYTPLTCAAGGQARGLHKVRIGNQYGTFKFNKVALFMTRYDSAGVENTSQNPVLYAIVALPNPVIKTNTGENISYVEVDVETVISASNYFGQVSYLTNSEFNTASPGVINYTGKVAIGSSAIPDSWEPRSRLHLYSETSIDHLRFSNEFFDYISFDMGSSSNTVLLNLDTSAAKTVDMRIRGDVSASLDVFVGRNLNVSGDFFNPHASILSDGVISTDNIIYTKYIEVYNTANFDANVIVDTDLLVKRNLSVSGDFFNPHASILSDGVISTDNIIYTKYIEVYNTANFDANVIIGTTLTVGSVSAGAGTTYINGNLSVVGSFKVSGSPTFYSPVTFYETASSSTGTIWSGYGADDSFAILSNRQIVLGSNSGHSAMFTAAGLFLGPSQATPSVVITSGGIVSAGGVNGYIYARNINISDFMNVSGPTTLSTLYCAGQADFPNDLNVYGTLTAYGALVSEGSFQINGGSLNITSDDGGLNLKTVNVTATGASSTTLLASCGTAVAGKINFGPYSGSTIICRVNTTSIGSNAVILLTPLGNITAPEYSLSVSDINEGSHFYVRAVAASGNLYGFFYFIINQS